MYYLHKKGRLNKFYRLLKKDYTKDPTGRLAFEAALGNRLWNIEPAWTKWVKTLEMPRLERTASQGRLGVAVKNTSKGCEVVELVEGGPAETAGRIRVGDVILKFNGKDVPNTVALFAAVRHAGALRTVVMVLKRGTRKVTIRQPLGAPKNSAPAASK
jgi:C-terminal processing protease CtpA/Prc